MLNHLRKNFRDLARGTPGDRFMRRYRGLCSREGPWRRAAAAGAGIALVALGFVLGPAPIVPGFIPLVVGLAMLAGRSRTVARLLDRAELAGRRGWRYLRRMRGGPR